MHFSRKLYRYHRSIPPVGGRWRVAPDEGADWQCFPAAPPLPQEAGAANAVDRYDPSRENGIAERPQALRYPEIINILSAIYAQSNAERILNRPPNTRPPGAGVKTAPGGHV